MGRSPNQPVGSGSGSRFLVTVPDEGLFPAAVKWFLSRLVLAFALLACLNLSLNFASKLLALWQLDLWDLSGPVLFANGRFAILVALALGLAGFGRELATLGRSMHRAWRPWVRWSMTGLVSGCVLLVQTSFMWMPTYTWYEVNSLGLFTFPAYLDDWVEEDHPLRPPIHMVTNSLGYRDQEWVPGGHPGVRRVLLIGDSQVAGIGIAEGEDVLDRNLEHELERRTGESWEVINGAIPGTGFRSYLMSARRLVPEVQPEAVVVFHDCLADLHLADPTFVRSRVDEWLWWLLSGSGAVEEFDRLGQICRHRECNGAEPIVAPEISSVSRQFASLNEALACSGTELYLWSWHPCPYFPELTEVEGIGIVTWSDENLAVHWREDPELAIPVDGHPLPSANRIVARDLAGRLLADFDRLNHIEARPDIGTDRTP